MNKRSRLIRIGVCVVLCLTLLAGAGKRYLEEYYPAVTYEVQTETLQETEKYIVYGDTKSEQGFIFYPGAKVDEKAYAPIMDELSQVGICCVLVKMPYHMAILDTDAAEPIMQEFADVEKWYIGGHSLGGAMAARFSAEHESELSGLILLAAYPTDALDTLPVLSLYGSEDGVLNREKYEDAISLASNLTEYVIEGGNHAGFGNYGAQDGDGKAAILEEEQWQETVDYILNFMRQ